MSRSILPLLALAACSPNVLVEQILERQARRGLERSPDLWARGTVYEILADPLRRTRGTRLGSPPPELRAAAAALAGCGQRDDDWLEFRILVYGDWPWTTRVQQATPGAEACDRAVLSQLPLDAQAGDGAARYVVGHTTLAQLRQPPPAASRDCGLGRPILGTARATMHADLTNLDELALAVTCPAEDPLTTLTVRYDDGVLAAVATTPEVPCVEARAREVLADVGALRFAEVAPASMGDWDEVTCTLAVPLRAPE
ncbi:MAG: hypothetical protein R3F59_21245 [Myxococcota bacterium]